MPNPNSPRAQPTIQTFQVQLIYSSVQIPRKRRNPHFGLGFKSPGRRKSIKFRNPHPFQPNRTIHTVETFQKFVPIPSNDNKEAHKCAKLNLGNESVFQFVLKDDHGRGLMRFMRMVYRAKTNW